MNPRRVHELMHTKFPAFDGSALEWVNVCNERGELLVERAEQILVRPFNDEGSDEVIVEVHRKLGDVVKTSELLRYLSIHVGKGNIRLANRAFTNFATLATSGVAAHWRCR